MKAASTVGTLLVACALVGADAVAGPSKVPAQAPAAAVPALGLSAEPAPIEADMVAGVMNGDEFTGSSSRTSGWDEFPYLRYTVTFAPGVSAAELSWTGTSVNSNDLAMHVRRSGDDDWGPAVATAKPSTPGGAIDLTASVEKIGHEVDVMIVDSPRADRSFAEDNAAPDGSFAKPGTYDFALQHITDTQYVSRDDPTVYDDMTQWTVDNAEKYDIDYSMHTGDIIQSWISPGRPDMQSRIEFEAASKAMTILEDAEIPHGVLPGNHDNLWNVAGKLVPGMHEQNHELYNEYFGPQRYRDQPWWGNSFTAEDNSAHYDLVDIAGVKFLMLYIGYNPPEKVMKWAEQVLDDHPDRNVVIGTHYYLDEGGEKKLMAFGDIGASSGQQIWNRLVVPHDSVFLVLSGHVDGQATVVDRQIGDTDRTVVQLLADYQYFEVDGERTAGFQRLLQFDLDGGTMAVTTHSPTLDRFDVENYDPRRRFVPQDGEFVTDFTLRADVPRAVSAG
ncbi:metallophosphoesterase [Rhodococcoides kyotonense]|uniref:Calcineurin-like phosphoesterase n=1 Tax=Rhodococcoides kyotonense TaxID=398843 RepID=A0A239NCK0_9NOCA|nr:metallophosphoesterase [Rhodococcus kyotonensis]SNT51968.1 Calcineurin-like phosphoesterase [Rhodococcus kyotonensis]